MSLFIKKDNHYVLSDEKTSGLSVNGITIQLGYNLHQLYSIIGPPESEITVVGVKVFTNEVIFVVTKDNILSITENMVQSFIEANTFEVMYDSITVQDILLEGIKDKAFNYKYISEVMGIKIEDIDGEVYVEQFDIYIFFVNGVLSSFKFGNDLSKWARHVKELNPHIITNYSKEASFFRNNSIEEVFEEVNRQCDNFANTPDGFGNEYIDYHKTIFGNIDFTMLLVCHYNVPITEHQFKHFNFGRYNLIETESSVRIYTKGFFQYHFDNFGILSYLAKII